MSKACQKLHRRVSSLPRFSGKYDPAAVPANGIYFVFEHDEYAHGGDRIVRVGTHTGENNLRKRIAEHLYTPNKDRSVFRKHIGRCLLSSRADPMLKLWELDLTPTANRAKYFSPEYKSAIDTVENEVSSYITKNLSFAVIEVAGKQNRIELEASLLSTISQCPECKASTNWLGRYHPTRPSFGDVGLWNVQGLTGTPMSEDEVESLYLGQV